VLRTGWKVERSDGKLVGWEACEIVVSFQSLGRGCIYGKEKTLPAV
jgi:hypothetical protein